MPLFFINTGSTTMASSSSQQRNEEIEFLRIILAVMVIFVHTTPLVGAYVCKRGYLAVDAFFLLSGYFMMLHAQRQDSLSTPKFLWRKIRAFLPETCLATLIACAVVCGTELLDFREIIHIVSHSVVKDIFLLKMTGIVPLYPDAIGATWYLSSLVIGMAMMYPCLRRWGTPIIIPIVSLMTLGYLLHELSVFTRIYDWMGVTYMGNIRALADLGLGAFACTVVPHLAAVKVNTPVRVGLTLFKYALLIYAVAIAWHGGSSDYCQLNFIVSVWLFIVLSFADSGMRIRHPLCLWLGKLSLPIYLSHECWSREMCRLLPDGVSTFPILAAYTCATVATALLLMAAASQLRRLFSGRK